MDTANDARFVMRHGGIQLAVSMLLGIPLAAGAPNARAWMGLHMTVMIVAILLLVTGLSWPHFRLGARGHSALKWLSVVNGYVGLVLGTVAAVFKVPGPVTGAGQTPDPQMMMILGPGFAFLGIAGITWGALIAWGLRGKAQ
jgi:hypothetical protein